MRYLKLFENHQTEAEVAKICQRYGIKEWTLNSNGLVDIGILRKVDLSKSGLTELPLKFGEVDHYFDCDDNELISLEGAPQKVFSDFYCSGNKLTSLKGAPKFVRGDFHCDSNYIRSFEGLVDIGGNFFCFDNPIYEVWKIINPGATILNVDTNKWNSEKMDLFNDLDIIRDDEIILDRLNFFLSEIGLNPVETVKGYKIID
jgi:hypothetical protein